MFCILCFQTDQIIAEYRARVRLYHPDKVPGDTDAGIYSYCYIFYFVKLYLASSLGSFKSQHKIEFIHFQPTSNITVQHCHSTSDLHLCQCMVLYQITFRLRMLSIAVSHESILKILCLCILLHCLLHVCH